MARKPKKPTIQELQAEVRRDVAHWKDIKKHGTSDPGWPDGTNLNLIRNHIAYGRKNLREQCREERLKKCPQESRVKLPRELSNEYCAPRSKAGPCRERRKRVAARKRKKARRGKRRKTTG